MLINNLVKKVVFLGAKSIGLECLKILNSNSKALNYEIVAVLTNSRGTDIINFCEEFNLNRINTLEELLKLENFDIGISVQYHQILKQKHISKAKQVFINLHMAPVPEYRGCNQFSFAILDESKIFGTTIHRLEEGIDSGDIIKEKRFQISNDLWVDELYNLTYDKSIELFEESLKDVIKSNYTLIPQSNYSSRKSSIHYRNEIDAVKVIDLDWPKNKILKHIRATYKSGFSPPYANLNENRIEFNIVNKLK